MRSYDIVVIGGGIVGTSILRELSKYNQSIALLEKASDVCEGASKANSGIIHTGFDAKPNTVEARLLKESRVLWPTLIESLRIPYLSCGALMLATDQKQMETIVSDVIPKAIENEVEPVLVTVEQIKEMAPYVTDKVRGGICITDEALVDPFWATRAFAELAIANGADILLEHQVVSIEEKSGSLMIRCSNGVSIQTTWVINAAGLWADEIARMVGDTSFTLMPRKGQFVLTEEPLGVESIILPVPTETSKGVLVTPVVFGGTLLGPTAEDQFDKTDRSTTRNGLQYVLEETSKLVPATNGVTSIRQFAGVRAVCSTGDYVIRTSDVCRQLIHVAGIRSTGVSASPGIGKEVERLLCEIGAITSQKNAIQFDLQDRFTDGSENGEIVCLCRSITNHEIQLVLDQPPVPTTLDAVKRRTGAMLGECQGNLCIPTIIEMIAKARGVPVNSVCKHATGSTLIVNPTTETTHVEQKVGDQ